MRSLFYVRGIILVLVCIFYATVANAIHVDSLRALFTRKNTDVRIRAMSEYAWETREKQIDTSLKIAHRSENLIGPGTDKILTGYVYHILGSLYSLRGDYEKSETWLLKAYAVRKKHDKKGADLLVTLTNLFYTEQGLGSVKKMHKYITEAEKLITEIGSEGSKMHIITVIQMADMYRNLNRDEKAEELFKYAIHLAEDINKTPNELNFVYTNYGNHLVSLGEYKKALVYFEKALVYQGNKFSKGDDNALQVNLAISYANLGMNDKAAVIFQKIYEIEKADSNSYYRSTSANNLGYFYYTLGKFKDALPLFHESLLHAKKAGAADLVADRLEVLGACYEELGDFKTSLKYNKRFQAVKDSLLDAETLRQLNQITEKYDSEKKEKKMLEYKKEAAESKLREKEHEQALNRNKIIYGSLISVVLVVAGFIFYSYRQKRKANISLEEKNVEIQHQHFLLEEKHKEITDSIHYAKRIQTALLINDAWGELTQDYFVYFKPKDVVSGDFYWAYETKTPQGPLVIWCAADCTGHGVPGAFMSMLGISFLNEIVIDQGVTNPGEILNKLREKIIKCLEQKVGDLRQRDGMDIALCVWNKKTNQLQFSGANNPLWIINPSRNTWPQGSIVFNTHGAEMKGDKMPVGAFGDILDSFSVKTIQLQPGDMLYTFTDGYADQFGGEKGKKFKDTNFKKLLLGMYSLPAPQQKEQINQQFHTWKGTLEQIDDVCVIGVRV